MRKITEQMIKLYKIDKLYDFLGYTFHNLSELTYHHLVVPRRNCEKVGIEADGYTIWNGAILARISHEYLHIIEHYDPEIFFALTSEMIDENINLELKIENLKRIRDLLLYFEHEHRNDRNIKGGMLIKPQYKKKRIILK